MSWSYSFFFFFFFSLIEIWFIYHTIHPFKMYSSVCFRIFSHRVMQPSPNNPSNFWTFLPSKKETPHPLQLLFIFFPPVPSLLGKHYSNFCLSRIAFSGHLIYMECLVFFAWLPSLSKMLRFIHIVVCLFTPFFFIAR